MLCVIVMPMPMPMPMPIPMSQLTTNTPTSALYHCRYYRYYRNYRSIHQNVSAAEQTVRRNMKRNVAKKLQGLSGRRPPALPSTLGAIPTHTHTPMHRTATNTSHTSRRADLNMTPGHF